MRSPKQPCKVTVKKTPVTESEKEKIRALVNQSCSIGEIALKMARTKSTIWKYLQIMGLKTSKAKSSISPPKVRRGRKPIILNSIISGQAVRDYILRSQVNGITIQSAKTLRNVLVKNSLITSTVSLSTIRRYCKSWKIFFGNSGVCPGLTQKNVEERLMTVSQNIFLDYKTIMFSDESMIRLRNVKSVGWSISGKPIIRKQRIKGNAGVMVWGAFSEYGFTDLMVMQKSFEPKDGVSKGINSVRYCRFLKKTLPPLIQQHPLLNHQRQCYFLQDNASIHKSRYTTEYLQRNGWKPIRHPPFSPDLNPIEKVWATLKHKISEDENNFKDLDSLEEAAKRIWNEIMSSQATRHKYAFRYREACMACLYKQGDFVLDNDIKRIRKITNIPEE